MSLDTLITGLALAFAACVLADMVLLHHHRRAARSRRSPAVLFGARSDD